MASCGQNVRCPRCDLEFEVRKGDELGGIAISGLDSSPDSDPDLRLSSNPTRARVRGKAREYSAPFEIAWRQYGRKEEKLRAFIEWNNQARQFGGEPKLLPLILNSLRWQAQLWAVDGWKFAPYFERYLKRRKWEDERPPAPVATNGVQYRDPRAPTKDTRAVDNYVAELRRFQKVGG